ncbi:MAG: hypothetical protein H0X72_03610 [Acidobacteria bacterium]|jgi:hypothetical protein|nr:hypothetical protein [Acidobacteriota bacterium]
MNETINEKGKLFTEKEAAEYFNWSVFTMRQIRKSGLIQHLVFNNKTVRYTLEQLEKYKNEHLIKEMNA